MRARTHVEELDKGNRQAIIVDEIPYQVNKANLLTASASSSARRSSTASPTCATSRTSPACAS
jgi:DNA gyrase/topoisomerase IV subunit A